jgi:acyl dehydratase
MTALIADDIPSSLRATFSLFAHARRGLDDPAAMPQIDRHIGGAKLDAAWLTDYRKCIGLSAKGDGHIPPLALQIAVAPLHLTLIGDARFPFRALGLVHMSQHITQTRAIADDAHFDVRTYTTNARWEKRGMSFAIVTEVRVGKRIVWRGETRALAMMKSPGKAAASPGRTESTWPYLPRDTHVETHRESIQVPEHTGRRYAGIAGDLNPIHQHALLARPFGFKRAIVHGTWTLARALVSAGIPEQPSYTMEASFRRPVELPSTIIVRAFAPDEQGMKRVIVSTTRSEKANIDITLSEN